MYRFRFVLLKVLAIASLIAPAQAQIHQIEPDPCGWPDTTSQLYRTLSALNWGYGYDSLLADLGAWRQSPYLILDSVGASVQHRTLFRLTITDPSVEPSLRRPHVWIHARTHPQEVEGTYVTNEMIRILLSDTPFGDTLRARYLFSIMPMYNPDGVELNYTRQNAHGVDLEANWTAPAPEPECAALRSQFEMMMAAPNPIQVALNMHSSSNGQRYFVYHSPNGTSAEFALLEQKFIQYVQSYTPGRIMDYPYFTSWSLGTALQYPESWFWLNHGAAVMALTYEDIYGIRYGFDSTAEAILQGVDAYLRDPAVATGVEGWTSRPSEFTLEQNYPNPFNGTSIIRFRLERSGWASLRVYDLMGREVRVLAEGTLAEGTHQRFLSSDGLASGTYVCALVSGEKREAKLLTILR